MAYCIRFVFDGEKVPSLAELGAGIASLDRAYSVVELADADEPGAAEIRHAGALIGLALLQTIDDPGSAAEIQEQIELLEALEEEDDDLDTDAVSARLWNATGLLLVEVQWEGEDHSESLQKLNLLWGMLLGTYSGILQADLEGYYDADGMLLDLA